MSIVTFTLNPATMVPARDEPVPQCFYFFYGRYNTKFDSILRI